MVTETDAETIDEMVARLRAEESEASENVADALERCAIGVGVYAEVVDVSINEALTAVQENDRVRHEFNKLSGGHDHAFGVALAEHFDHTTVVDGPDGPRVVQSNAVTQDAETDHGPRSPVGRFRAWLRSLLEGQNGE